MKRILSMIYSLSWRKKMVLSSVFCLIVPALLTISISSLMTKDALKEQAIINSKKKLERVDLYVTNLINKMIYTANFIQFDEDINSIVRRQRYEMQKHSNDTHSIDVLAYKEVTNKLENISVSGIKMYVSILVSKDLYYTNYSFYNYSPQNFYNEPWFQNIEHLPKDKLNWMGVNKSYIHSNLQQSPYMITFVRIMQSVSSSKPFGYIIVSLNENKLSEIFKTEGSNEKIVLINSEGTVISGFNDDIIGNHFSYLEKLPSKQVSNLVEIDHEKYLLVAHPLSFSNWKLMSLTPYKQAVGQVQGIYWSNILVQALFFSIFLIILVYLVRQFTKPIVQLGNIASDIEAGNIEIRSNIRGSDEVGRLGHSFDRMLDRIQDTIRQIKMEQSKKRKAELEMLQAQVNPHFLFNLLNSIRLRIMLKGDEESADLIQSLSSLLRMTINRDNEFISLNEEFEIAVHYAKLMNVRRKANIDFSVNLSSDCGYEEVPRFFIQPLVENAFIHGIKNERGKIVLSAWKDGDELIISVEDNGLGMGIEQKQQLQKQIYSFSNYDHLNKPANTKRSFSGIGIKNIYERMRLIYGEEFYMNIGSHEGEGTKFTLHIPMSE